MMERIPPHNLEAEQSVLGSALLSKDALFDILEILSPADFYSETHKEIFEAVTTLHQRGVSVDVLTVSEELKKRNALEMVGGRAYVATLSTSVPTTSNAAEYARIVGEKSSLRRLIGTAEHIIQESYEENSEASQIMDSAEKEIFEVAQKRQRSDYSHIKDVLLENINIIDKVSKMEGDLIGLTTGFRDLDQKLSGLQKSDLIILAARPAMGKTSFALSIAQQAAIKGGGSVMIFSLEMGKEQLGQRLLSMESRVEMEKLKHGKTLERSDWDKLNLALDSLSKANINIDDTPGITVMEMKNKCRRLKAEKGLDLIVVDYLQLMNIAGKSESRTQEVSALSRSLKLMARELDCPVIVLSQLSRAPEQRPNNHRPMLADLRESGSIEQDADIVMFLYRDEYYNEETENPGECEVIVAKHRNGPTGTVTVTWLGKYTRFADKK